MVSTANVLAEHSWRPAPFPVTPSIVVVEELAPAAGGQSGFPFPGATASVPLLPREAGRIDHSRGFSDRLETDDPLPRAIPWDCPKSRRCARHELDTTCGDQPPWLTLLFFAGRSDGSLPGFD